MSPRLQGLDPEIAGFVATVCDESARLSAGRRLDWPQRRAIAEAVRAPWRSGGPAMAVTEVHDLPSPIGNFRVRLYRPQAIDPAPPVLVYLHGGGWCLFSIDTHDRLMREYADAAGICVLGVDYALAPEHPFPAGQDQCVQVIHWLRANAGSIGIDASRLALAGDSAGANLALTTTLRLREQGGHTDIRALLLNYGGFDTRISEAARPLGSDDDMLTCTEMREFWHSYLGEHAFECKDPLAVPAHADLRGLPPSLLLYGDRDVLGEQSVAMDVRLREAGVVSVVHAYPATPHSFIEAMSVSAIARDAIARGADWLRRHLHSS